MANGHKWYVSQSKIKKTREKFAGFGRRKFYFLLELPVNALTLILGSPCEDVKAETAGAVLLLFGEHKREEGVGDN